MSSNRLHQPYPAYPEYPANSWSKLDSQSTLNVVAEQDRLRSISKTPEPTQEEYNFLHGIKEKSTTKQKLQTYAILIIVIVPSILISVYQHKIVDGLKPFTDWLNSHPVAAVIPIALLALLSFPPLFGSELILILVGVAYSLPVGFAIAAAGTLLGELATYFVFKTFYSRRNDEWEAKSVEYGLLAHVTRNGGFWLVLVIRYSTIPPHYSTVVFSVVGVPFGVFLIAAVLSLPRHLVTVYIGYSFQSSTQLSRILGNVFPFVLVFIAFAAYWWVNKLQNAQKEEYIYFRRKARQAKAGGSNQKGVDQV
ncbi:hypothetical protein FB45DRAFT_1104266 [Roridomyces roridus]|uniref:Golgi apparatus membrane protein TVP38 n=1 Tax=Roridomyces roridus TaxID=1738132 RepID=A0AAD7BCS3_9AGAR|nr:hypothetical protein FB45DRAFT_1104266 [Roridomyces roridus]